MDAECEDCSEIVDVCDVNIEAKEKLLQIVDVDRDEPDVRWLEILFRGDGFTVRSTSHIAPHDDIEERRANAIAGVMRMVEEARAKIRAREKAR